MTNRRLQIREFIAGCLLERGDEEALADSESLFLSGRLDSLSVTRLVVFLEEAFGVDFGTHAFDVTLLDSVDQIVAFSEASTSSGASAMA
jgi:acyl carrier protein